MPRPSSVVISAPFTVLTGVRQERTARPLTMAVQEPHWPSPQPNFGPFQREIVAEHIQQRRRRIDVHRVRLPVDFQRENAHLETPKDRVEADLLVGPASERKSPDNRGFSARCAIGSGWG